MRFWLPQMQTTAPKIVVTYWSEHEKCAVLRIAALLLREVNSWHSKEKNMAVHMILMEQAQKIRMCWF